MISSIANAGIFMPALLVYMTNFESKGYPLLYINLKFIQEGFKCQNTFIFLTKATHQ